MLSHIHLKVNKNANKGVTVEKRVVSEEYVREQVAKGKGVIKEVGDGEVDL